MATGRRLMATSVAFLTGASCIARSELPNPSLYCSLLVIRGKVPWGHFYME